MGKQPQGQATLPAEAKKFTGKTKAQLDLSVATQRNAQTNVGQLDLMIEKAIESKAAVENLERLLNLKYEYEKRENEKAFHAAFCEMQGEFPTIKKGHSVKVDGKVVYKYAALEDILRQIQPVLKKFGFAYSWSESMAESKEYKRIICKISGHGHSETAFTDVPVMGASKMTNAAQQAGSSSTYGKRYSLVGILGIMTEDDDDGRGVQPAPEPQRAEPRPPSAAKPYPMAKNPEVTHDFDGMALEINGWRKTLKWGKVEWEAFLTQTLKIDSSKTSVSWVSLSSEQKIKLHSELRHEMKSVGLLK